MMNVIDPLSDVPDDKDFYTDVPKSMVTALLSAAAAAAAAAPSKHDIQNSVSRAKRQCLLVMLSLCVTVAMCFFIAVLTPINSKSKR